MENVLVPVAGRRARPGQGDLHRLPRGDPRRKRRGVRARARALLRQHRRHPHGLGRDGPALCHAHGARCAPQARGDADLLAGALERGRSHRRAWRHRRLDLDPARRRSTRHPGPQRRHTSGDRAHFPARRCGDRLRLDELDHDRAAGGRPERPLRGPVRRRRGWPRHARRRRRRARLHRVLPRLLARRRVHRVHAHRRLGKCLQRPRGRGVRRPVRRGRRHAVESERRRPPARPICAARG